GGRGHRGPGGRGGLGCCLVGRWGGCPGRGGGGGGGGWGGGAARLWGRRAPQVRRWLAGRWGWAAVGGRAPQVRRWLASPGVPRPLRRPEARGADSGRGPRYASGARGARPPVRGQLTSACAFPSLRLPRLARASGCACFCVPASGWFGLRPRLVAAIASACGARGGSALTIT